MFSAPNLIIVVKKIAPLLNCHLFPAISVNTPFCSKIFNLLTQSRHAFLKHRQKGFCIHQNQTVSFANEISTDDCILEIRCHGNNFLIKDQFVTVHSITWLNFCNIKANTLFVFGAGRQHQRVQLPVGDESTKSAAGNQ